MIRSDIVSIFRGECPEIPSRVIADAVLYDWCEQGDKEFCAETRCIVDQGSTIETEEDEQYWVLTDEIENFYDIDDYPGSGVLYNSKKIDKTTMAVLDMEAANWRDRDSGTPKKWFRRGAYLWVDRPIDSNEYDLTVYSVLIPDDWDDDVAPFNQLTYLEPFHRGMVEYLKMRAKKQVGKPAEAERAAAEYTSFVKWTKSQLGGNQLGPVYFRRRR